MTGGKGPEQAPAPPPGTARGGAPLVGSAPREHAKIRVRRAGIRDGKLDMRVQMTSLATGKVAVTYHAAGRRTRYAVTIPKTARSAARARTAETAWSFARRLPTAQRRTRTGIITLEYQGNSRVLPDDVRLRAASGPARLQRDRTRIDSTGRLIVEGTISRRAAGVVRIRMGFVAGDGSVRFLRYRAKIRSKAGSHVRHWRLKEKLPADAARAGGHLSIQFTGYRPRRIRGEQTTKLVTP